VESRSAAGIWSFPGQNDRIPAIPRPDSGLLAGERVAEWSGDGDGLFQVVCFFLFFFSFLNSASHSGVFFFEKKKRK
jgi:hypothetical protein